MFYLYVFNYVSTLLQTMLTIITSILKHFQIFFLKTFFFSIFPYFSYHIKASIEILEKWKKYGTL